jgi:hypothetical protein
MNCSPLQQAAPNLIEIAALASILHSFHNGLENIFISFTTAIHHVSTGTRWRLSREPRPKFERELKQRSKNFCESRGLLKIDLSL